MTGGKDDGVDEQPMTVVFRGGPADGEEWTVQRGTRNLRWAAPPQATYEPGLTAPSPWGSAIEVIIYAATGELDDQGRAIFTRDGLPFVRDLFFCPTSGEVESFSDGGWATCCNRPDLHRGVE